MSKINNTDIQTLINEFDTPLICYDKVALEKNLDQYIDNFKSDKFDSAIAYASKALSIKEMYRIIKQKGTYVDTVSIGEIYTAFSVGIDSSKVLFHGNNKTKNDLIYAIENKVGYIIVDNFDELDLITSITNNLKLTANILLRINPVITTPGQNHEFVQTANRDSKFGILKDDQDLNAKLEQVKENPYLEFCGIHSHIGSQINEYEFFDQAINVMYDIATEIYDNTNMPIKVLNIGGGYGQELDVATCMKKNVATIENRINLNDIGIKIVAIEPGRSIVNNFATTFYTIGSIKEIKDVDGSIMSTIVSVDGSMSDNPRPALYAAKYEATNYSNTIDERVMCDIAGRCCESGDFITRKSLINKPKCGDIIGIEKTGAYTYSMASNYNKLPKPAVVFVDENDYKLVVRRQSLEDLINNEI